MLLGAEKRSGEEGYVESASLAALRVLSRFTMATLEFLGKTRRGEVREGALKEDQAHDGCVFSYFFLPFLAASAHCHCLRVQYMRWERVGRNPQ